MRNMKQATRAALKRAASDIEAMKFMAMRCEKARDLINTNAESKTMDTIF